MRKHKLILALCTSVLMMSGCQSSNALLLEYSDINMIKSDDVLDIVPAATVDAFAKNIAVISGDGSHGDMTASGTDTAPSTDASADGSDVATDDSTAASTDAATDNSDNAIDASVMTDGNATDTDASVTTDGNITDASAADTGSYDASALSDTPALLVNKTTNEVLYYNKAFNEVAPASLTKLMTALLALKYGTMTDTITLTAEMNYNMVSAAQTCGFLAGDQVTLKDLFNGMLVYSGNETANAIGIYLAGNMTDFVAMMNDEAVKLGATNSYFVTANGLDATGHYSSAYDLYLIFDECMKYDDFVNAIETANLSISYQSSDGTAKTTDLTTTNYYLKGEATSPDGLTVYGGKTGTTDEAGACLICYVKDTAGQEYIAVSLGNSSKTELYSQMNKILAKILN